MGALLTFAMGNVPSAACGFPRPVHGRKRTKGSNSGACARAGKCVVAEAIAVCAVTRFGPQALPHRCSGCLSRRRNESCLAAGGSTVAGIATSQAHICGPAWDRSSAWELGDMFGSSTHCCVASARCVHLPATRPVLRVSVVSQGRVRPLHRERERERKKEDPSRRHPLCCKRSALPPLRAGIRLVVACLRSSSLAEPCNACFEGCLEMRETRTKGAKGGKLE